MIKGGPTHHGQALPFINLSMKKSFSALVRSCMSGYRYSRILVWRFASLGE